MIKIKELFITDKQFYKEVFRLVLPLTAINSTSLILSFFDVFMLGRTGDMSETAISAAKIASQPFFLFSMLMFGSMSGAMVLCSQYWGKKDTDTINSIAGTTLAVLLPISIIFMSVCFIFAKQIMGLISGDATVVEMAVIYLRILLPSIILNLLSGLFSGILRSVENVKIPMAASFAGITVNIILDAILIYGFFGFPKLGIQGAATAALIARTIEFSVILIYVAFFEKTVKFTLKKMFRIHIFILRDFFKYSLPVIANEFIWGFGMTIHSSVIGHMSKDQYAAYTVSGMIGQIAELSMIGFATGCCIIIGKSIGEGKDNNTVMKYARTFQGLAVFFALITGGITFVLRDIIINLFEISDITKTYASQLFTVMVIISIAKTFNCVSIVGIIRGGGDTKTGMILDACAMYFWGIPLGFFAMYVFKLNVIFVCALLISDELIKVPVCFLRIKSRKWIRNITRSKEETGKTEKIGDGI